MRSYTGRNRLHDRGRPIDSDLSGIYRGSDIPQGADVSNALPAAPNSSLLNRFYQSRSGQLAWQEGGQLLPEAQVLLSEVQKSYQHGLTPNRYLPMALLQQRRLSAPSDAAAQLRLDKHLSYAYLNYIADVRHGRVGSNRSSGLLSRAQQGLAAEDFGAWLDAQAPSGATYRSCTTTSPAPRQRGLRSLETRCAEYGALTLAP